MERFLNLIDRTPVGAFVARRQELLEATNPDRIYVENIRSFFGFPYPVAKRLCDRAVREHLFERRVGFLCPNEGCRRMILSVADGERPPDVIECEVCELGEIEPHAFRSDELTPITFYKLLA